MPAMSDAPLRGYKGHEWFWNKDDEHKVYPLESLIDMYHKSVGHNSTLIIGLTPDNRGVIPDLDAERCKEWGDAIQQIFRDCIGKTEGEGDELQLTLENPKEFTHIVIQEDIRNGERVRSYSVEAKQGDAWTPIAEGTCIGHKRIHKLESSVISGQVRLKIEQSVQPPVIKAFALYRANDNQH
jgi:alpha-L-fucosidase